LGARLLPPILALLLTPATARAQQPADALPEPRLFDTPCNIGFIAGAVLGALAGVARHNSGGGLRSDGRQVSLGENVAAHASVGSFVGWMTGRAVVGRARCGQ
jgi:hypothetical protein